MDLKFKKVFVNALLIILIFYIIILVILFFFQRSLLYHPSENNYSGDKLKVLVDEVKIKTKDNIELLAWYHEKNKDYKTILFLHGNAGSLENRIHKINHFENMNINFLIISWRGFSGNKGSPNEKGLYEDAKSAVNWLKNKGFKTEDIILYGESLGTGVVSEIAQRESYAGVILESPFTSMVDAAKNKYPFFPISFLLKDKYESDKKIKNINCPILVMHGEVDNIVPFWMGKKMYNIANEPKYSYFSKYDNHMMEYDENLLTELNKFINSLN